MRELIVDLFAGGGGASCGIEMALGRSPDIAVNHDPEAIALHTANHPATLHLQANVWHVDPLDHVQGRPVGLLWASPDCKHFSKAKGGRPVKRSIRDLAWVVVLWAKRARPRVILLENVEEFRDWGPVGLDERPCPERRGQTFDRWVGELKRLGYRVEWRELRACDYGAPTSRKRLFLIARRDGRPIVWPEPTHAKAGAGGLHAWRAAAEIIDWSLPCPSIFLSREEARAIGCKRPLEEATMARIARGVKRYVLESGKPFIAPITHRGDVRVHAIDEPVRTITTAARGELALIAPHLMTMRNAGKPFTAADEPTHTITAGGAHLHLVAAFLAQHNGGATGHEAVEPVSTITMRGTQQNLVAVALSHQYGEDGRGDIAAPARTVTAGGNHHALVAAFLAKYYGTAIGQDIEAPAGTVTTRDRFGLVTVKIAGEPYVLADIGMRMLTPRELFAAQGFPASYIIDRGADGKPLTKTAQIKLCGNSVSPPIAAALAGANCADLSLDHKQAA